MRLAEGIIGERASHNHKPTKGPLRTENGTEVVNGYEDRVLWLPPRGDIYV